MKGAAAAAASAFAGIDSTAVGNCWNLDGVRRTAKYLYRNCSKRPESADFPDRWRASRSGIGDDLNRSLDLVQSKWAEFRA